MSGEHFVEVLDRVVDKFNSDMKKRIDGFNGQRLKSVPVLKLYREGRITRDLILAEMPKLQNKTSTLPRGERDVYSTLISDAVKQAAIEEAERVMKESEKKEEETA